MGIREQRGSCGQGSDAELGWVGRDCRLSAGGRVGSSCASCGRVATTPRMQGDGGWGGCRLTADGCASCGWASCGQGSGVGGHLVNDLSVDIVGRGGLALKEHAGDVVREIGARKHRYGSSAASLEDRALPQVIIVIPALSQPPNPCMRGDTHRVF